MAQIEASTIEEYNSKVDSSLQSNLAVLLSSIQKVAKTDKSISAKIYHRTPIWFKRIENIDHPIFGYYQNAKKVLVILFWSGQSFNTNLLEKEGSFKAAQITYTPNSDINIAELEDLLSQATKIIYNYGEIVKNKGHLTLISM